MPLNELFHKLQVDPTKVSWKSPALGAFDVSQYKILLWADFYVLKQGLTQGEAKLRLERDGKNALTPPKEVPEMIKFLREMVGGFSPLLLVGSLLCFVAFGVQYAFRGAATPFDNVMRIFFGKNPPDWEESYRKSHETVSSSCTWRSFYSWS